MMINPQYLIDTQRVENKLQVIIDQQRFEKKLQVIIGGLEKLDSRYQTRLLIEQYGIKLVCKAYEYLGERSLQDEVFKKIIEDNGFDKCAVIYCKEKYLEQTEFQPEEK